MVNRSQKLLTHRSQVTYDSIVSEISDDSICSRIYVRRYAEPVEKRPRLKPQGLETPESWSEGRYLYLDTETVNHKLTFGYLEYYVKRRLRDRFVFYRDNLPKKEREKLQRLCRVIGVNCWPLAMVFARYIWRLRKRGGTIVGFNVSYDLSRLATCVSKACKSARKSSRFLNGFEFLYSFISDGKIVERTFWRAKRDDRFKRRDDMFNARVLDLASLFKAHTDCGGRLQDACAAFGIKPECDDWLKATCERLRIDLRHRPGKHSGEITLENVLGCVYDVQKTVELGWALLDEHARHPIALPPHRAQSPAALAKAYRDAMGIKPRLELQPDFPRELLEQAANSYFGGRVESSCINTPLPVAYLDASSMYPTIYALLEMHEWDIAHRLEVIEHNPQEVQTLLKRIQHKPKLLLKKNMWKKLAFFALVKPNGAILPTRVEVPKAIRDRLKRLDGEGVKNSDEWFLNFGPTTSDEGPLWYSGPDLAVALLKNGEEPRIVKAWTLKPNGSQPTLKTLKLRGQDCINPSIECVPKRLIELRKSTTSDVLDNERRDTGYKCIANCWAYGIWAETNPVDVDPDKNQQQNEPVRVWPSDSSEIIYVNRPERPGRSNFFPIASLVTAGARLLLSLAEWLVKDAGGTIAYCDTDSLFVVATEESGFVQCESGDYRTPDGSRYIKALSWRQVEAIREQLNALNVYVPEVILDTFKLEKENYQENNPTKPRRKLWLLAKREKLYALYTLDERDYPTIVKHSAHGLGYYRSPMEGDTEQRWIKEAWLCEVRKTLGLPFELPKWVSLPAIAKVAISTWNIYKLYEKTCWPFDFLAVTQFRNALIPKCCGTPRPSCIFFDDPQDWESRDWRCLTCAKKLSAYAQGFAQPVFALKTYGELLMLSLYKTLERKRLSAAGTEPSFQNLHVGLTVPRPVCVRKIKYIGKEVIVDLSEASDDELPAELFSATRRQIYESPLSAAELRRRLQRRSMSINNFARASRVGRRTIFRFLSRKGTPERRTVEKMRCAIRNDGGESGVS